MCNTVIKHQWWWLFFKHGVPSSMNTAQWQMLVSPYRSLYIGPGGQTLWPDACKLIRYSNYSNNSVPMTVRVLFNLCKGDVCWSQTISAPISWLLWSQKHFTRVGHSCHYHATPYFNGSRDILCLLIFLMKRLIRKAARCANHFWLFKITGC